ncbi:hypothetical protein [Brevibacillus parabrevis]|uniref:hypothetical protein n=1 Tax=Brevibacillus parabrevis TaxID=54914 RepID=UPI00113DE287|nr:hypothetical protein [Brevibacillus parabrevis]TGV23411.1 hypothetical protein EN829_045095 [Mesorhizobium sp. M00.F.Ca.ET.186.01.1.1]
MDNGKEFRSLLEEIIELSNKLFASDQLFLDTDEPKQEFLLLLDLRDQLINLHTQDPSLKEREDNKDLVQTFQEVDKKFGEMMDTFYQELKSKTARIRGYRQSKNVYDNVYSSPQAFFYDDKG